MRRGSFAAIVIAALLGATAAAGATPRVHATLAAAIPANRSGGDHVTIAWHLRDRAGRTVTVRRVFVRIVCPEGTDSTTTYAQRAANGLYRVVAVVPPGGIGTFTIRTRTTVFPITNLHRR